MMFERRLALARNDSFLKLDQLGGRLLQPCQGLFQHHGRRQKLDVRGNVAVNGAAASQRSVGVFAIDAAHQQRSRGLVDRRLKIVVGRPQGRETDHHPGHQQIAAPQQMQKVDQRQHSGGKLVLVLRLAVLPLRHVCARPSSGSLGVKGRGS
jgi:hypothetical protein